MADTLEQIAERLVKGLFPVPMGTREDFVEWRDRQREAILSALQSLAPPTQNEARFWSEIDHMNKRQVAELLRHTQGERDRAVERSQSLARERDDLQQRVESLSQSLVAALERCQAAVQEPRGQEGE
jgi:hypothetical protein